MTTPRLTAFKIPNDRLQRWCLLGEGAGTGKPVFATGIRNGDDALRLALAWEAFPELLAALEASTHIPHQLPGGDTCTCGQCSFVVLRDRALEKFRGPPSRS